MFHVDERLKSHREEEEVIVRTKTYTTCLSEIFALADQVPEAVAYVLRRFEFNQANALDKVGEIVWIAIGQPKFIVLGRCA